MVVVTLATVPVKKLLTALVTSADHVQKCYTKYNVLFDLISIQYIVPTRIRVTSSDGTLHALLCSICHHHPQRKLRSIITIG